MSLQQTQERIAVKIYWCYTCTNLVIKAKYNKQENNKKYFFRKTITKTQKLGTCIINGKRTALNAIKTYYAYIKGIRVFSTRHKIVVSTILEYK